MPMKPVLVSLMLMASLLSGQSPLVPQGSCNLSCTAAPLGGTADLTLSGLPLSPYLIATDLAPGNVNFPGFGRIYLGITPNILVPIDGFTGGFPILPPSGLAVLPVPIANVAAFDGGVVYMQAIALEAGTPPSFSITNAVSSPKCRVGSK